MSVTHRRLWPSYGGDTVPLARRSNRFPCSGGTEYLQSHKSNQWTPNRQNRSEKAHSHSQKSSKYQIFQLPNYKNEKRIWSNELDIWAEEWGAHREVWVNFSFIFIHWQDICWIFTMSQDLGMHSMLLSFIMSLMKCNAVKCNEMKRKDSMKVLLAEPDGKHGKNGLHLETWPHICCWTHFISPSSAVILITQ